MIQFHPISEIFPLMEGVAFDELVTDIELHGLREPIVLLGDLILDGRNRYRACLEGADEPRFVQFSGDDPLSFVISLNLRRRHLNESQRARVADRIANLRHGGDRRSDQAANLPLEPVIPPVTQAEAAAMLNVGERLVRHAHVVSELGAPELGEMVDSGRVAVSTAADVARLPKEEQREIVARGEKEIIEAAKQIRAGKTAARKAENDKTRAARIVFPDGRFDVVVMDPPWPMEKIERDVRPNQVAFDYPTMDEAELLAYGAEVEARVADDCHFFMWTTHKFLPLAFTLLEAWGFRYVCTFTWHKPGGFQPIGLPQYNCEFVLYARRGTPRFVDTKSFPCCFDAPRREHSRKPDEFYATIQRVTDGRRVDWFSRETREGFESIGNETEKFVNAHVD